MVFLFSFFSCSELEKMAVWFWTSAQLEQQQKTTGKVSLKRELIKVLVHVWPSRRGTCWRQLKMITLFQWKIILRENRDIDQWYSAISRHIHAFNFLHTAQICACAKAAWKLIASTVTFLDLTDRPQDLVYVCKIHHCQYTFLYGSQFRC